MADFYRFQGTGAVAERLRFDPDRLNAWLTRNVGGFKGPIEVTQFKGGQSNPTYLLDAPSGRYVLRRKPPGKLLPSAHAIDREFRVISALYGQGVPVARPLALCLDENIVGTPFYLMAHVDGRVFWDPRLPELGPPERRAVYDAMNQTIAKLHTFDYRALGLEDWARPGNYVARQIARWSQQYRASETEKIPAMDRLIDWLPAHVPEPSGTSIVHGDYRIDNLIFDQASPRILAVVDWELSTVGDPLADFAYHVMYWRLEPDLFRGLSGVDFEGLNIPGEAEYVASYCARTGREQIPHWDFYIAYNMFRIAAILQGIMGRVQTGTAASEHAADAGLRAKPLAEAAWAEVEKIKAKA
jgi:aminoglycoside phosphotransferase (APT) family kinase protein